jgi:hypothetical protein
MGLRKKWAFNAIDWDDEFKKGKVCIDPKDLQSINKSELIEILKLKEIRAYGGVQRDELIDLLTEENSNKEVNNPIDYLRQELVTYITEKWDKIRDQLMPHCKGNCYDHHDIEVIMCYLQNENTLTENEKE